MKVCAAGGYLTILYCLAHSIKTHRFAVLNNKIRALVNAFTYVTWLHSDLFTNLGL